MKRSLSHLGWYPVIARKKRTSIYARGKKKKTSSFCSLAAMTQSMRNCLLLVLRLRTHYYVRNRKTENAARHHFDTRELLPPICAWFHSHYGDTAASTHQTRRITIETAGNSRFCDVRSSSLCLQLFAAKRPKIPTSKEQLQKISLQ